MISNKKVLLATMLLVSAASLQAASPAPMDVDSNASSSSSPDAKAPEKEIFTADVTTLESGAMYISHVYPQDPETHAMVTDIKEATALVMKQLEQHLSDNKMSFAHVVETEINIADMSKFGDVNTIYGDTLKAKGVTAFPARATFQVELPEKAPIRISMTAVADGATEAIMLQAPPAVGPYSSAILKKGAFKNTLYISGTLPLVENPDKKGEWIALTDINQATPTILGYLETILKLANMTFKDVTETTILVLNAENLPAVEAMYSDILTAKGVTNMPKLGTMQAVLPRGATVEIKMTAAQDADFEPDWGNLESIVG